MFTRRQQAQTDPPAHPMGILQAELAQETGVLRLEIAQAERCAEDFADHINGLRKTDLTIRHGQFILMQTPQGLRPGRRGQRKGQRHRQQERQVLVHNLF